MIKELVFFVLGGLGLFLYGMKLLSEGLQVMAGDRLRRIISAVTDNRVLGVGTGLLVTMIVQSSSVTTVMVVSFVNAGVMELMQAASVVLGANIGTTITGWILVLKIHKYALPILGLGTFAHLFGRSDKLRYAGQLAMGFGLIFFGLSLMKDGFSPLKDHPGFAEMMHQFGAETTIRLLMSVMVGAVLTMIVQSSSAMLGVTIAMASVGLIDFEGAAALILGENIGTTITAQLAAIGATTNARRAAMFHSLVNVFGVGVMVLLFPLWIHAVDAIIPGPAGFVDAAGERPNITAHISMAHSSFNVVMVLVALPLLGWLVRGVERIVPESKKVHTSLKFLHTSMIEAPALAIEQGRQEVFHMAEIVKEMLEKTAAYYVDMRNPNMAERDRVLRLEKITDVIQHEITVFMARVAEAQMTTAQSDEIRAIVREADELESIADYCERLVGYRSRALKDGVEFSDAALADIQTHLKAVTDFYEAIIAHERAEDSAWMPEIQTEGDRLKELADRIRDAHLERAGRNECNPTAGIVFSDAIVALRRIRNHSYNLAEAFVGQK
ncbi:MAG: Na/Pi cotransporter family protein [Chrysiogenetes bacterium]|nr:Na/Pi cotransporter family protein [Chrysiogenetes bacterium]